MSSSSPSGSGNTRESMSTSTTTSGGAGGGQSSVEIDAGQLKHWASPEELLGIKNLLGDLRLRHNTELAAMQTALEQARGENETLRRDAQAFVRLKDAYMASENDFQRMKSERASWHEEREMLVLKLQQASNEILRLKQSAAAAAAAPQSSSSGSGGSRAPSSSLGSLAGGSTSSSEAARNAAADSKFLLAIAESEHRRECEVHELSGRLQFQSIVHDMSQKRMQQRVAAAEAELRVTKEKLVQYKNQTRSLQHENDTVITRYATLEGSAKQHLTRMEADLRAANEARATAERAHSKLRDESEAKLQHADATYTAKVSQLLSANAHQSESLTSSLNRAVESASKADEIFEKERTQLVEELRGVNDLLMKERAKSDNDCLMLSQRVQIVTGEKDELQAQFEDSQGECAKLRARLDVCSDTIASLRNEIDEQHAVAVRQHNAESAATTKAQQLRQLATERDAAMSRAASSEQQFQAVAAALERERSQSLLALEVLQRKRDEREVEIEKAHSRELSKLTQKYRDAKLRLKDLASWRDANQPPKAEPPAAPPMDALAVMQQQFASAAHLARGTS